MYSAFAAWSKLNSLLVTKPLVSLEEGERMWKVPNHFQCVLSQNWVDTEPKRTVTCMVLKPATNDINYAKWINDGETRKRQLLDDQCYQRQKKGRWKYSCLVQTNRSQRVAQMTAQYNASPRDSEHTVQRTHIWDCAVDVPTSGPPLTNLNCQQRLKYYDK
ncbi:hypothetical protein TNCV_2573311 [Trichonephila clavipes]|nr:hypothetical protein TNCV_2573311 [Trichonephila clavipes]